MTQELNEATPAEIIPTELEEAITALHDEAESIEKVMQELVAADTMTPAIATECLSLLGEQHLLNREANGLTPALRYKIAQESFLDKAKEVVQKLIAKAIELMKWVIGILVPKFAFKESMKASGIAEAELGKAFDALAKKDKLRFEEALTKSAVQEMVASLSQAELISISNNGKIYLEKLAHTCVEALIKDNISVGDLLKKGEAADWSTRVIEVSYLGIISHQIPGIYNQVKGIDDSSDILAMFKGGISITTLSTWIQNSIDQDNDTRTLLDDSNRIINKLRGDIKQLEQFQQNFKQPMFKIDKSNEMVAFVRELTNTISWYMKSLVLIESVYRARIRVAVKCWKILLETYQNVNKAKGLVIHDELAKKLIASIHMQISTLSQYG